MPGTAGPSAEPRSTDTPAGTDTMWTVSNALTGLRLVLVPVFIWQALRGTTSGAVLALAAFVTASITDSLDGYYARKHGTVTDLGRFLDPLADKLLTLSAFYWAASGWGASQGWFSIWFVHIIAVREVGITALRMVHRRRGRQIRTAWSGKWKTILQITVLITVLALEAFGRIAASQGWPTGWLHSALVQAVVQVLFALAVIMTVISGVRYLTINAHTDPLSDVPPQG